MEENKTQLQLLQDLLDNTVATATQNKNDDPEGTLMPMFIGEVDNADGTRSGVVVASPFTGDTEEETEASKVRAIGIVRMTFLAYDVARYCHVSEAWQALMLPGETLEDHVMPSKRMDRKEIVIAVAADREGNVLHRVLDIVRDWNGGGVRLVPQELPKDARFEGRMTTVLKDLPTDIPPVVREMIKIRLASLGLDPLKDAH